MPWSSQVRTMNVGALKSVAFRLVGDSGYFCARRVEVLNEETKASGLFK